VTDQNPIPLRDLSFPVYIPTSKARDRAGFLSIVHFFEAEKFRGFHPELFEAVMHCPSLRELSKLTKRNQAKWRDDWSGIRGRVLVCAMRYASWADPNPERWTTQPEVLAAELETLGFPAKFCAAAVTEFQRLNENPVWNFLGVDKAPPDSIGKRVNDIHRKTGRAWTINHWLGRHTSWRLHEWALSQYVPMRYFGAPDARLTPELIQSIAQQSTHTCIFEAKGGKTMDAEIRQLRALKVSLEMEFFQPSKPSILT
jgi:hypothetical protein